MDFIPFNNSDTSTPKLATNVPEKINSQQRASAPNSSQKSNNKRLAFGNPANMPAFGSPALSFGSPAVQSSKSPMLRTPSPRHFNNGQNPGNRSPNVQSQNWNCGYQYPNRPSMQSPRSQHMNNYSPRHNGPMKYSPYSPKDGSSFKAPHPQSPQGHGNRPSFGRKAMTWTPGQGGHSGNFNVSHGGKKKTFEDLFYGPHMIEDPWRGLQPTFVQSES